MGQQSLIGAVTMKCFVVLSLALAAASAIHIPKKYEHYKPGYMRIPGWEDIASGKRKLNQKESTKVFTPRSDTVVKAACGVPGPMAEEQERIVGGVEATPHQSTLIGTAITLPMIWLSSSLTPQLTLPLNPM